MKHSLKQTLVILLLTTIAINTYADYRLGVDYKIVDNPLPVKKAYDLGAKRIIVIRTYEEKFKRKLKLENYIGAFFSKEYPKLRKALLRHDKTYNSALDFIQNPPSDCEVIQLCPPTRLKSKRDSKNVDVLKADYNLGQSVAENYLSNLKN